jgi:hypothetical protein
VPVENVQSALARTLRKIHAYEARDKPKAAERLAVRIVRWKLYGIILTVAGSGPNPGFESW